MSNQYHLTVSHLPRIEFCHAWAQVSVIYTSLITLCRFQSLQKKRDCLFLIISSFQQWPVKTCRCHSQRVHRWHFQVLTAGLCLNCCRYNLFPTRALHFAMVAWSEVQSAPVLLQHRQGATENAIDLHELLAPAVPTQPVLSLSGLTPLALRKPWIGSVPSSL